ncbi:MAG: hypothetical protein L3V56_04525 [Candidatus Magnetoovum sp. WYHC-5]|nr:hypothetical protein [Candidatus Magnetoovum sp. WYHC-5]
MFYNRRNYLREDTYLPFEARLLTVAERDNISAKISDKAVIIDFSSLHSFNGKSVNDWLKILIARFESLSKMMDDPDDKEKFQMLKFKRINLGGGG